MTEYQQLTRTQQKLVDKIARNDKSRRFIAGLDTHRNSGDENMLYVKGLKHNQKVIPLGDNNIPTSIKNIFDVEIRPLVKKASGTIVVDEDVPNSMRQSKHSRKKGRKQMVVIHGLSYDDHKAIVPVLRDMIQQSEINLPKKRNGPGKKRK